ncbi:hydroxyacylglutathione hydrolase [Undibacterium sp. SXout7W]|uniref:hydroxyacylglutathione hydrolase n=1 Tax=Undibacterium sp. SXout7W TaxID=3413049 RepID=UPI003BF05DCE
MKNSLSILTVPAFDDNYLWIVHNGQHAAVIDPGDALPILQTLEKHSLRLAAILLTHHHSDHVGGVTELLSHTSVPVFGPTRDHIPTVTHALHEGDPVNIPELEWQLRVIDVPGHTAGHIAYFAEQQHWLFCGDTLFAGGCGRLFEGTPAQMLTSLEKLACLPEDTAVYCAHEYTLSNLRFAQEIEPDNLALQARVQQEQEKRAQGIATVPSQIGLEKQTNPFLRSKEASVIAKLLESDKITASQSPAEHFAALRMWKNHYA